MAEEKITLSYDHNTGQLQVDKEEVDVNQAETLYWAAGSGVGQITGITIGNNWPFGAPASIANSSSWMVEDPDTEGTTSPYEYTISAMTADGAKTLDPQIVDEPQP
jgi:hypothetical protein